MVKDVKMIVALVIFLMCVITILPAQVFPPEAVTGPFPTGNEPIRNDSPIDMVRPSDPVIYHEYTCYKVSTAPVIDGDIETDEVWAQIPWTLMTWYESSGSPPADEYVVFSGETSDTWYGPDDCTAWFKLLWDGTKIYVAVKVYDDEYQSPDPGNPSNMHVDDCIQLTFHTVDPAEDISDPAEYGEYLGCELGFAVTEDGVELWTTWNPAAANAAMILADGDNASGHETTDGKAIHASVEESDLWIYRYELAVLLDDEENEYFWSDYFVDDALGRLTIMAMDWDVQYENVTWASGILTKDFARYGSILFSGSAPTAIPVETVNAPVPEAFSLVQNYPNPFNPSTQITYTIAKQEYIQLNVYSLTGEKIATLVNQNQRPGTYQVVFNAENLPSGIYFYQLETSSTTLTRKMTLVK